MQEPRFRYFGGSLGGNSTVMVPSSTAGSAARTGNRVHIPLSLCICAAK